MQLQRTLAYEVTTDWLVHALLGKERQLFAPFQVTVRTIATRPRIRVTGTASLLTPRPTGPGQR